MDESPDNREITALLISYRSAMGALMLPRAVAALPDLQAASPAVETAHLTALLGTGGDVIEAFGFGLLALSGIGFFVALFGAVSERRRELALLRTLGGRPSLLFSLVALEGVALGLGGGVAGLAIGRAAASVAAQIARRHGGPALPLPDIGMNELLVIGAALGLSLAAAIAPAVIAYRTRPAIVLKAALVILCMSFAPVRAASPPADFGQPADERAAQKALPQSDSALWGVLRRTRISEDVKRGLFSASFPADVTALDGQTVTLTGFMLPIDAKTRTKHFLLSKYTPVCFFCPPGEPNEVVEVVADKAQPVSDDLVSVTGKLSLIDNAEKGLFFRISAGAAR